MSETDFQSSRWARSGGIVVVALSLLLFAFRNLSAWGVLGAVLLGLVITFGGAFLFRVLDQHIHSGDRDWLMAVTSTLAYDAGTLTGRLYLRPEVLRWVPSKPAAKKSATTFDLALKDVEAVDIKPASLVALTSRLNLLTHDHARFDFVVTKRPRVLEELWERAGGATPAGWRH